MGFKQWLQPLTPPIVVDAYRRLRFGKESQQNGQPQWELVPEGWRTRDPAIKGWNVEGVVETSLRQWPAYVSALRGPEAIRGYYGGSPTSPVSHVAHNVFMTYAFVVTLAARMKDRLSILDWGGGLGQYCLFTKSLLHDVQIEYHCKDVPLLCEAGKRVLPEGHFHETDECLNRTYDLVFASNSIQYHEHWRDMVRQLATACGEYFYLTRVPVVEETPSFVAVQRPYLRSYNTEYIGWILNRKDVLDCIATCGMQLVREFHLEPHPEIVNAPAPALSRGFLARRVGSTDIVS